jgi:hypothetical protein
MSHRSEDLSILAEKLQTFLTASGWVEGRQAKGLRFFYPPAALGIEGKYSIALPDDSSKPGVDTLVTAASAKWLRAPLQMQIQVLLVSQHDSWIRLLGGVRCRFWRLGSF